MAEPGDDIDLEAAEYVLGVGDARAAAETRLTADPAFAEAVDAWTRRLTPLAEATVAVAAPDLWPRIERATRLATVATLAPRAANDNRLGFWRAWAAGASALAAASVVGLMIVMARPAAAPPHQMLATLRTHDGAADIVISYNTGSRDLILTPIGAMPPAGRMPHLWLKRKDGGMEEMGPVDMAHPRRHHLSAAMGTKTEGALDLMVSLESADAGRLARPTGPIVARGAFALV